MAIIRFKEIVAMSSEDRAKKIIDMRVELARMRTMIKAGGAVENPTRVRELRKTIAQLLTVENEKKLGIRQPAGEEKPKKKAAKPAKKPIDKKETEEITPQ